MKNIFLAVLASICLLTITHQPKIFVGTDNHAVAVINSRENLPVTIKFIHSVQKTPVIEELELKNGEFVLVRTKYQSQGVGLPFDAADGTFHRDGNWFIFDMNRKFHDLELRTGKCTQLTIILDGKTYELYKIFPIGTKIIVKTF